MNRRQLTSAAIGLVVGVLAGSIIFLLIRALRDTDVQIVVAVIAATTALITTGAGALINQGMNQRREALTQRETSRRMAEEAHRARKVEIYDDFIRLVSDFMQGSNENNKKRTPQGQPLLNRIEKFQNGILLWGSPRVLRAYLSFRRVSGGHHSSQQLFASVEELYLAMRDDLGLSNEGLSDKELVRLYLKNPSELDSLA
jgi:hypothetical protein